MGAVLGIWAVCYVITDLRIYPPPSPSHRLRPGDAHQRIKTAPVACNTSFGLTPLDRERDCTVHAFSRYLRFTGAATRPTTRQTHAYSVPFR